MTARIATTTSRMERLGQRISATYEDKLEGRIDDAFVDARRAEWEAQRAQAAEDVPRLARVRAKSLDMGIFVLELGNKAYDLLSQTEPLLQRRSLQAVCSNSVLAEEKLTVNFRRPFDPIAQWPRGKEWRRRRF